MSSLSLPSRLAQRRARTLTGLLGVFGGWLVGEHAAYLFQSDGRQRLARWSAHAHHRLACSSCRPTCSRHSSLPYPTSFDMDGSNEGREMRGRSLQSVRLGDASFPSCPTSCAPPAGNACIKDTKRREGWRLCSPQRTTVQLPAGVGTLFLFPSVAVL